MEELGGLLEALVALDEGVVQGLEVVGAAGSRTEEQGVLGVRVVSFTKLAWVGQVQVLLHFLQGLQHLDHFIEALFLSFNFLLHLSLEVEALLLVRHQIILGLHEVVGFRLGIIRDEELAALLPLLLELLLQLGHLDPKILLFHALYLKILLELIVLVHELLNMTG